MNKHYVFVPVGNQTSFTQYCFTSFSLMAAIATETTFFSQRTRLNFVSGKGGVGKTTLSCALAWKARKLGLETLLLTINAPSPIEALFGFGSSDSSSGEGPREIVSGLWVMNLDQLAIFDDFIRTSLKIRRVYEAVLSSHVYQYFTAIAPGIKELFTQDVIFSALSRTHRFQQRFFDMIIVDSPATGHGLSWFSVPEAVLSTFLVGPLNKKAREIKTTMQDSDICSIHLATLPEEMPVKETIFFYQSLRDKLHYPVKTVFLNGIFPQVTENEVLREQLHTLVSGTAAATVRTGGPFERAIPAIFQSAAFSLNRRRLNESYLVELRRRIDVPVIEIPQFFNKQSSMQLIEMIGDHL